MEITADATAPEPLQAAERYPDAPPTGEAFARFASGLSFELDAYQRAACGYIEAGSGVLVAAPTGAGKTIAGEFAVFMAQDTGRKCFYTTPIKALSNQKYADLVRRYGEEKVGLLTGDASVNGEAPIVVMTTEVLRNMIYAGSRTLRGLGYVVMDEVHYLGDRFRGPVWEEVIIGLAESVQIVALSATVSNVEEFGDWLAEVRGEMAIVVSERRPVPLFEHVMAGRRIYDLFEPGSTAVNHELIRMAKEESKYVRDDSRRQRGRRQRERIERNHHADRPKLVPRRDAVVERLEREHLLPAIFFIFSRAGCDAAVAQLMNSGLRLTSRTERDALEDIARRRTEGLSRDDLDALGYRGWLAAFREGIAAHHAGLLPAFKEALEEAFVRGLVKVVFATETLALGINMPAKSVVLEKLVKFNGEGHVEITPGEYTQLTGRAGRRGIDVEGHAVVLWGRSFDPRAVAGLASRRTYPLRSAFKPTYNMAVNLVGSVGRERARVLLEQSFAQYQSDRGVVGLARQIARNTEKATALWAQAACSLGDFEQYAHLRDEIGRLQDDAAKARRATGREQVLAVLEGAQPGDIWQVHGGRHAGWMVVIDPGLGNPSQGPRPLVLDADRDLKRLAVHDITTVPTVAGRMRIPKHFNPRQPSDRRNLAAAFRSKLAGVSEQQASGVPVDGEVGERIERLRAELGAHPCHSCPDREVHARFAEQAARLERESAQLRASAERRTNTIAVRFDRVCSVLEALGYLTEGGEQVAVAGRILARLYGELDLVSAEAVRAGIFEELTAPELAAVLSTLLYESRGGDAGRPARLPNRSCEIAVTSLRQIRREVGLLERDFRLERGRELDVGFAEAAHAWASGADLADVLAMSDLTAGDFVRWTRQIIDHAGQVADAAGPGPVRDLAREAQDLLRRGVVSAAYDN